MGSGLEFITLALVDDAQQTLPDAVRDPSAFVETHRIFAHYHSPTQQEYSSDEHLLYFTDKHEGLLHAFSAANRIHVTAHMASAGKNLWWLAENIEGDLPRSIDTRCPPLPVNVLPQLFDSVAEYQATLPQYVHDIIVATTPAALHAHAASKEQKLFHGIKATRRYRTYYDTCVKQLIENAQNNNVEGASTAFLAYSLLFPSMPGLRSEIKELVNSGELDLARYELLYGPVNETNDWQRFTVYEQQRLLEKKRGAQ
jgi:hypothetical protein